MNDLAKDPGDFSRRLSHLAVGRGRFQEISEFLARRAAWLSHPMEHDSEDVHSRNPTNLVMRHYTSINKIYSEKNHNRRQFHTRGAQPTRYIGS